MKRIVVGITGASGTIYAVDLLEKLHQRPDVEVHLVMSAWAKKNLELETDYSLAQLTALADAQIIPPIPAFYNHPQSIQDLVNHQTMKILDAFHIHNETDRRWEGD